MIPDDPAWHLHPASASFGGVMTKPDSTNLGPVDTFETTIEKLITGGVGLGRYEGQAAFIPLTAPGDRVRATIIQRKKGFVTAELAEVLTAGPDRRQPPCPHYGVCGGCDLQHLTEAAQLEVKADIVADCFRRLGGMNVAEILTGPEPAGPPLGYRGKIRLFASPTGLYGMMRRGTNEVVPLETCLLLPEAFRQEILPWLRTLPPMEQIVVRLDGRGGFLISLFGRPNRARPLKRMLGDLTPGQPPLPGCIGLLLNNLPHWGRDYLILKIAGRNYRVGSQSFSQANLHVTESVIATVESWLEDAQRSGGWLVDCYSGVGLFSLALAPRFDRVLALDTDSHAVRDARNNVERDRDARGKVEVREGSMVKVIHELDDSAQGDDQGIDWQNACCLLDPPRRGLGERAVNALVEGRPRDILYLSCDPATLARDVAALTQAGYVLRRLQVFDMFPQTAHIETLLHLERGH
jgi:23S rRNA (uracil1939-C5)-methyltransferase